MFRRTTDWNGRGRGDIPPAYHDVGLLTYQA